MPACLPREAILSLSVCAMYATASLVLAMLNKALLSSFHFSGYFLLLACQMGFSYAFCVLTRDAMGNPFKVPAFNRESLRMGGFMGVLYVANVVVGMIGAWGWPSWKGGGGVGACAASHAARRAPFLLCLAPPPPHSPGPPQACAWSTCPCSSASAA